MPGIATTRSYPLALAAMIALALGHRAEAGDYPPPVGATHPQVTLRSVIDGSLVSLSQYRGRKVLLINFASW